MVFSEIASVVSLHRNDRNNRWAQCIVPLQLQREKKGKQVRRLSYDKRAHNGIQIIIYILDLCYNILEGESSPARGEGIV